MAEPYMVIVPAVKSVSFSVNPVATGGKTVLTVKVVEETKAHYPEERYAGEFHAGE